MITRSLRTQGLLLMALPQESQGLFEAAGIKVYYTGVGKIKSTYAAAKLIEAHKPQWILNLGTAGSKKVAPGTLVECSRYVQRDPLFSEDGKNSVVSDSGGFISPSEPKQFFPASKKSAMPSRPLFSQKIFKSDALTALPQVTCGTADFIEYAEPLVECDIFDMEAYALAYVCEQTKVKFNSIKFVTDSSDKNVVKDWNQNLKPAAQALYEQYLKLRFD